MYHTYKPAAEWLTLPQTPPASPAMFCVSNPLYYCCIECIVLMGIHRYARPKTLCRTRDFLKLKKMHSFVLDQSMGETAAITSVPGIK